MLAPEALLMFRIFFLEGLLNWIKAGGGTRQNSVLTAPSEEVPEAHHLPKWFVAINAPRFIVSATKISV
jgi:hypothetical protein